MVRRTQQNKRELKRSREAAAKQLDEIRGTYEPNRDGCLPRQWETGYDDPNTIRLQFNIWRKGSTLVDFVILVQRLAAAGWQDVERFDCCHGNCHLHAEGRDAASPIYQLDSEDDVKVAFDRACAEAEDRARIIRDKGEGGNG